MKISDLKALVKILEKKEKQGKRIVILNISWSNSVKEFDNHETGWKDVELTGESFIRVDIEIQNR